MLKSGANFSLLDESTRDLDAEIPCALEDGLKYFLKGALVINHGRKFLDRIATHIMAFEGGSQVEWSRSNYSDYEEDKKRRLGGKAD